jgi:hypothetical protein
LFPVLCLVNQVSGRFEQNVMYVTTIIIIIIILTTIGLTPGSSSCSAETCRSKIDILNIWFTLKKHFVGFSFIISTQNIENGTYIIRIKKIKNWEVRAVPRLCDLYPGICLTTKEKARKTFS